MKKLIRLFPALAAVMLVFSACEETPPVPVLPTMIQVDEIGTVADGDSVLIATEFFITVKATQGDDPLNRITVQENGTDMDPARVTLDGDAAGSFPSPLPTEDQAGFQWKIGIKASDTKDETNTYDIIVTDATGNTVSVSVDIKTYDDAVLLGTYTAYLLLNQAGPAGTGGLDLDTGNSTGSQDTTAEIKDMGIDNSAPTVAENWIQKISPTNDAEMRYPDAAFDFEMLVNQDQLLAAWEAGVDFTVSEKVSEGDLFLVKRKGKYYALKTGPITITPADNKDQYEFTVKR